MPPPRLPHDGNFIPVPKWVVNLVSGLILLMVLGASVTVIFVVVSVFALFAGQAESRKQLQEAAKQLETVDSRLKKVDKAVKEGAVENNKIPR